MKSLGVVFILDIIVSQLPTQLPGDLHCRLEQPEEAATTPLCLGDTPSTLKVLCFSDFSLR